MPGTRTGALRAAGAASPPQEQPAQDRSATPDPSAPPPIAWHPGPMTADLGGFAELQIPEGFLFADKAGTVKLLEVTHNLVGGHEVGAIVPAGEGKEDA